MKFSSSLISVKDVDASRKFYEDLFGLEVQLDIGWNVIFSCGLALQLHFDKLIGVSPDSIIYKANNFELSFEEENFDEFISKLKEYKGIIYLHDVMEHEWGQRVIRFYDLDSHLIEVGEDMRSIARRYLKQGLSVEETAKRIMHPIDFVKSCCT